MPDSRVRRAKLNIFVSIGAQIVAILCGLVVPNAMINAFGSEAYGAVTSIAQFLAYITLLEGGIGGVARAALYKPLADNDTQKISQIVSALKRFFRAVAFIFAAYVVILSLSFHKLAGVKCFDWISTIVLVLVISISTFAQYFIGISYAVLIQASQRTYITNAVSISTTILNTVLVILLINFNCNIIIVKLVSSCVFILRPILMFLYVKRKFHLIRCNSKEKDLLPQKWSGLGQHIAFFLHSNTDIALLTIFSNLSSVAIYSVYNMITTHIQGFTVSFSDGMEALFGDMLAKDEKDQLHKTFNYYEMMISLVAVILFSTTAIMIVPFMRLYTAGVTDADYIQPVFAVLLVLSSVVYCFRIPYHSMVIAAGHFKQTRIAAYGEAVINIIISIVLLVNIGLIGVAIGTLSAVMFRFVYYVFYLSKNIMNRSIILFVKRQTVNVTTFAMICTLGMMIVDRIYIGNFWVWVMVSACVAVLACLTTIFVNFIFYHKDLKLLLKRNKGGNL